MNLNEYAEQAMKTEADQGVIGARILREPDIVFYTRLNNGITGLTDEVGELNAARKKWIEYGQPLDVVNIKEEVGDCLWRLAQICKACGFTLNDAADTNIQKLQKSRYKNGYSEEAAKEENRDREGEKVLLSETKTCRHSCNKRNLSSPVANGMIQNGHGFGEPPEDYDESGVLESPEKKGSAGFDVARQIADRLDGQERKHALMEIEREEQRLHA